MRKSLSLAIALYAGTTLGAWAQVRGGTVSVSTSASGTFHGSMSFMPPPFAMPPAVGQPYSAEQVSESVQVLADGTRITRRQGTTRLYRDSAGRTRTERPAILGPNAPPDMPAMVQITDPGAGFEYVLDAQRKIAHRWTLPPPNQRPASPRVAGGGGPGILGAVPGSAPGAAPPQFSSESLGTQVIEGVLAEGRRTTHTLPAGAIGNDRPIVSTSENWISPDLKMMVLSKNTDPRYGETTTKLTNISRAEPDPALFQPPPDYQVVEETGRITIDFSR